MAGADNRAILNRAAEILRSDGGLAASMSHRPPTGPPQKNGYGVTVGATADRR